MTSSPSKPAYTCSIDEIAPGDGQTAADRIVRTLIADPFTRSVIHRRVTQLLRLTEFANDSKDDLTQEFLIRLTDAMKHHDDDVGHRNPYIVSIVDRHSATLIEHRRALVRNRVDDVSLEQRSGESDAGLVTIGSMLDGDDRQRRLQTQEMDAGDQSDLKSDLTHVARKLSDEDQRLVRMLRDQNVTDVAKTLGVPRSTLVSRVENIAAIFEDEGLRGYLS